MPRPRPHRSAAARALPVLALTGAAVVLAAPPASGHASGELPHARLSAEDRDVAIDWTAPADDAALIGTVVGVLGEGAMEAYLGGDVDDLPSEEEIAALSRSDALREYLLGHVEVRQVGADCAGEVEPADDFIIDGARFVFRCPDRVEQVDVRITVLHDQDPRYQTYAVDGTIWTATHTSASPEHTWDATAAAEDDRSVPWVLPAALGAVAAGTATVLWRWRPRARTPRRR